MGNARPIEGRPQNEVQVGPDKLEVVASFCYLGDLLSAGGGCEITVTTHVKTALKEFRELLPVVTSHHLSYKTHGHVYSSCVRSAGSHLLLPGWHDFCWWRLRNNGHYSCENSLEGVQGATTSSHIPPPLLQDTWPCIQLLRAEYHAPCQWNWPMTKTNLLRLQRNDRATIRQICSIKSEDVAKVRSSILLAKLEDLDLILRERRLRWFGHVEHSSGAIRTACDIQTDGRHGAGRPKLTWKRLRERYCSEWKLTTVDPQERSTWRSVTWKGAHWCGWCLCTCMLIKNLIMLIIVFLHFFFWKS